MPVRMPVLYVIVNMAVSQMLIFMGILTLLFREYCFHFLLFFLSTFLDSYARNGYLVTNCIYVFVIYVSYLYTCRNFNFRYVPAHLHLMVFELVKNSLRAVQERFMDSDKLAPIRIIVADGIEDVTIKVSS